MYIARKTGLDESIFLKVTFNICNVYFSKAHRRFLAEVAQWDIFNVGDGMSFKYQSYGEVSSDEEGVFSKAAPIYSDISFRTP